MYNSYYAPCTEKGKNNDSFYPFLHWDLQPSIFLAHSVYGNNERSLG